MKSFWMKSGHSATSYELCVIPVQYEIWQVVSDQQMCADSWGAVWGDVERKKDL